MRRKPVDNDAAMAQGVDYLLREFRALNRSDADTGGAADFEQFEGPIEVTYLVAASNARDELRALADFVCNGDSDHLEIQAALDLCSSLGGGRVVLTEGTFSMPTNSYAVTLDVPAYVALVGVGRGVTEIQYKDSHLYDFSIVYGTESEIAHFAIKQEPGS